MRLIAKQLANKLFLVLSQALMLPALLATSARAAAASDSSVLRAAMLLPLAY